MSKEELIKKAKAGRIEFHGNVPMGGVWQEDHFEGYFAQYADENGVHACPYGQEEYIDDFEPCSFDKINESTCICLGNDIAE